MAAYSYETFLVDQRDRILTVTLNRPETLNAINGVMHGELEDLFGQVGRDPEVNVLVLTGAGRSFHLDKLKRLAFTRQPLNGRVPEDGLGFVDGFVDDSPVDRAHVPQ